MPASLHGFIFPLNMGKPPFFMCTPFIKVMILKKKKMHYCFELNMPQYVLKAHIHWKVLSLWHAEGKCLFWFN